MPKVILGVDPHKRLNAVVVLNMRGVVLARRSFTNTTEGFRELRTFSRRWRPRRWAIEGCNGVGKQLAQRLVAAGEEVVDVSTRRAALVRVFAEGNGRKNDDVGAVNVGRAKLVRDWEKPRRLWTGSRHRPFVRGSAWGRLGSGSDHGAEEKSRVKWFRERSLSLVLGAIRVVQTATFWILLRPKLGEGVADHAGCSRRHLRCAAHRRRHEGLARAGKATER